VAKAANWFPERLHPRGPAWSGTGLLFPLRVLNIRHLPLGVTIPIGLTSNRQSAVEVPNSKTSALLLSSGACALKGFPAPESRSHQREALIEIYRKGGSPKNRIWTFWSNRSCLDRQTSSFFCLILDDSFHRHYRSESRT
jgi:hypothetical protein